MALDFLGGLTQAATGIGGFLNALGVGKPKINYNAPPSERQANSLFQALLDPNNSLVKQNTDINMQKGMQDMLMQLKIMQMHNARGQARGLQPALFSPERADETLNYLLTRGQPAIAESARNRATSDIRSTAESLRGFGATEQQRINDQNFNRQTDYQNMQMQGGYGGMANRFGGGLQDLFTQLFGQNVSQGFYGQQVAQGFGPNADSRYIEPNSRYIGGMFN